eukprot:COSAG06_NODE_29118_length_562_cov_1.002160_1_plen_37_part_10
MMTTDLVPFSFIIQNEIHILVPSSHTRHNTEIPWLSV